LNSKLQISNFKFRIQLKLPVCAFVFLLTAYCSLLTVHAQKLAVLVPEKNAHGESFAGKLEVSLSPKLKILDDSLSETAFRSADYENPFNLTTGESKIIAAAIGCDYFLLVKSGNWRRSTFAKAEFYESFAAVYVVSARTGRLVFWRLSSFENESAANADKELFASTNNLATEIFDKLKIVSKDESSEKNARNIEELPAAETAENKNLRPPLPYKRIKPEYTKTAYLYNAEATVDIEIEVDEKGNILKTEIVRWAGFGLDESVTEAIKKMQWRAADRDGKPLPMRVLLRYNFKKPVKEN
jgi:TonB family protein